MASRAATCTGYVGEIARIYQVFIVFVYWLGGFGTADETTIITFMRLKSGIMASATVVVSLIVRVYFVIEVKEGLLSHSDCL